MRLINNFVGVKPIEVAAMRNPHCGALVSIRQDGGAMSFLHSMKPAQAVELADALMAAAEEMEPGILTLHAEVTHAE